MGLLNKNKMFLSVCLREQDVRMATVAVSPQGKRLVAVHYQDVPNDPQVVADMIRTAVQKMNARKAAVVCAMPSSLVITKNIEIPSLDPKEIHSIIDLQAGRHTPYSREEILIGYVSIGVFQRNYTKVLLVLANRTVIMKQIEILANAGLRAHKVLFAPESLAHFYSEALGIQEEDDPIGILEISTEASEFVVEFNRTSATCRGIPVGVVQMIAEGDAARNRFVDELKKSLEVYENEDINKLPVRYILTGAHEEINRLRPVLQQALNVEVVCQSFLDQVAVDPAARQLLEGDYKAISFASTATAGMMASSDQQQIDLTPDELKMQQVIEQKGRQMVFFCVLAFLFLALFSASRLVDAYFKKVRLDKLNEIYESHHRDVLALDSIAQRSRILRSFIQGRMTTLDVLDELYMLIPNEIYLQNIFIDEDGTVNIQGISETMSRVFNLVTALEESVLFKNVKTRSTSATKDRGKDAAAFDIVFKLEVAFTDVVAPEAAAAEGAEGEAAAPAAE